MGAFSFKISHVILVFSLSLCALWTIDGLRHGTFKRSKLCPNSPDDGPPYRFHRETRKCYEVGQKGPCPELMKFSLQDDHFGMCDCDHSLRCGRPLVYWPNRGRCYFIHDQGPCREGKWLVFGFDLHPVCRKNICRDLEEKEPSYGAKYWFSYNNTCYRTYTQGYCSQPDEVLYNMKLHYRPTCQKQPDCGQVEPAQRLECLPGQRLDVDGYCKRKFIALTNKTDPEIDLNIQITPKPNNIYCLFCDGRTGLNAKK